MAIIDTNTKEVLYRAPDPEEWVWVRRKPGEHIGKGYCVSWLIQRKSIGVQKSVTCKKRVRENGTVEGKDEVTPDNFIECSEYEAFNYWKPQLNYQIY